MYGFQPQASVAFVRGKGYQLAYMARDRFDNRYRPQTQTFVFLRDAIDKARAAGAASVSVQESSGRHYSMSLR